MATGRGGRTVTASGSVFSAISLQPEIAPYLHSVRLIDELLKKGKGDLVSFMTYPGEFHYFTREHVLRDAWRRVDEFFAANLRP
jgi:hypothetical protein